MPWMRMYLPKVSNERKNVSHVEGGIQFYFVEYKESND